MNRFPFGVRGVGGRPRRTERQNPYHRPRNSSLQAESCAHRLIDDSRHHSTLNEDALYPGSSQERSRSRNHRHSDRYFNARRSPLKSPPHSTVRNRFLPSTHKDFQVGRADIFQDVSGQRSETAPLISRNWSDMVEMEELASEQQNSDFEAEYIGLCPEQMKEVFEDVPVQRRTSSHVRQNSMMSNPSSFGSDSTESKKIRMSATPRFTESELDTKEVQATIERRKKQIQYGKVLECYHRYNQVVPRNKRTKYHPQTPDIYRSYSRRGFDTLVRTWKKQLHAWEPAQDLKRSVTLGSTCESAIATGATTETKQTCKKETNEDWEDYDLAFPNMPASASVKTDGKSELHSVGISVTMKAESSNDDAPVCDVLVKTERPDDRLCDEINCN